MKKLHLVFIFSIIFSQNSKIIQPTISSGFVQTNGLKGTLGQTFFQKLESDNVAISAGFWGGVQSITLDVENDVLPTNVLILGSFLTTLLSQTTLRIFIFHKSKYVLHSSINI